MFALSVRLGAAMVWWRAGGLQGGPQQIRSARSWNGMLWDNEPGAAREMLGTRIPSCRSAKAEGTPPTP